jgi:hypothetical protein
MPGDRLRACEVRAQSLSKPVPPPSSMTLFAVLDDLCLMTPLNSGRALAGSAINLQSTPCHQLPQTTTPANHAAPNFEAADES